MSEWLGLLRWSIAVNDGTLPSNASAMSAEDRAWLEGVMKDAVRDDPKRMDEIMLAVKEYLGKEANTADEEDNLLDQLDELRDIVEQIDMAHVFVKFGGSDVFCSVLEAQSKSAKVRSVLAAILATVAQNNVMVQYLMLDQHLVERLSSAFMAENDEKVLNKLLFAISCAIRGHPAAEETFVLQYGGPVLTKALSWQSEVNSTSSSSSLTSRALFLCSALLSSDFASAERTARLSEILLPLTLLKESVIVEEGDLALHAIYDLLRTSSGHALISTSLRSQLDIFLDRVCQPAADDDGGDGEKQRQRLLIEELVNAPFVPRASVLSSSAPLNQELPPNPSEGQNDVDGNDGGGGGGPLLMIEPPQLVAASRVP